MHDIFFTFFNHFLCRFASSFYQNIYCGKNTNYQLTTKQGDRFASCENVVSRSQTSSLPPFQMYLKSFIIKYKDVDN